MKNIFAGLLAACALLGGLAAAETNGGMRPSDAALAKKLTHQIRMYPRYSIFDNISFSVNEGRVALFGAVNEPYKKSDLEHIVQRLPGVASLTDEIKVLPPSPLDDRLRMQVARAIYRDPVLSRYAMEAVPPIHIIVDAGHVTLEGEVSTDMEKNVAGIRANGAGLSFGQVTNNLRVENPSHQS